MSCILLALALCLLPIGERTAAGQQGAAAKTVILVRHAERAPGEGDVPLGDRGRARAEALARLLVDADIQAIIVSDRIRTQQTAEPLARQKSLEPEVLPADKLDAVIERVRSVKASTVLVVHHSNTVPVLVDKLGGKTPPIRDDEFDRVVIMTILPTGAASMVTLRYPASTQQF